MLEYQSDICKVCQSKKIRFVTTIPFMLPTAKLEFPIKKCCSCGSYFRDCDYTRDDIQSHFQIAGYNLLEREQELFDRRIDFFHYILRLTNRYYQKVFGKRPETLLDIGPSYGHMLEVFSKDGFNISAVELLDSLRERLQQKWSPVYKNTEEVPEGSQYDVITVIDVLYYFEDPLLVMKKIRQHLKSSGILVLRVANRAPILTLAEILHRPITHQLFLDHKYHLSIRGTKKLLDDSGFQIIKTIFKDKGKKVARDKDWFWWKILEAISYFPMIKLYPGVIIICRGKE